MEFKIEKGVALPKRTITEWPHVTMEVGDSFIVPKEKILAARSYANYLKKKKGLVFLSSKENEQYRIHRVK